MAAAESSQPQQHEAFLRPSHLKGILHVHQRLPGKPLCSKVPIAPAEKWSWLDAWRPIPTCCPHDRGHCPHPLRTGLFLHKSSGSLCWGERDHMGLVMPAWDAGSHPCVGVIGLGCPGEQGPSVFELSFPHRPGAPTLLLQSWDFFSLLGDKCDTGHEVLRHSVREDHVSTSAEWVCLSSHSSDLQSSLPRETSCSSAIYDPPLKSTLPMTQPTAFKVCSVLTFI